MGLTSEEKARIMDEETARIDARRASKCSCFMCKCPRVRWIVYIFSALLILAILQKMDMRTKNFQLERGKQALQYQMMEKEVKLKMRMLDKQMGEIKK